MPVASSLVPEKFCFLGKYEQKKLKQDGKRG